MSSNSLQSAGVCSYSIAIKYTARTPPRYHTPSFWPSLCTLISNRRSDITPPPYHPAQLRGSRAWCSSSGVTKDTTPPYYSTPGHHKFKGQKVINGLCFPPCSTVPRVIKTQEPSAGTTRTGENFDELGLDFKHTGLRDDQTPGTRRVLVTGTLMFEVPPV